MPWTYSPALPNAADQLHLRAISGDTEACIILNDQGAVVQLGRKSMVQLTKYW
jgi:hypothetical protein